MEALSTDQSVGYEILKVIGKCEGSESGGPARASEQVDVEQR